MLKHVLRGFMASGLVLALAPTAVDASHISGIRISQTGNTGLMINVDITGFYTTGSTETTMYLGTYYNQIPAADWGDGSILPRYGYGSSTGIPLVATSTVVNGQTARAYRGSFSHTYGAPGSYTISANTRCCPLTTPTNTLVTGTIQTTTVTTSGPFGPTTFTTSFVQNTLQVEALAPGFSKVFAPDSVGVGVASTLTFTIDNTASTLDDNNLDFTDNLPAGLTVAATPNVVNSCTGGTVTAAAGTSVISYTGGEVAAGATCTISVDVSSPVPGSYDNTSGDLTSSFGNSGPATDTLTVTAVPPGFSKDFDPNPTGVDVPSTLTFTLDNTGNAAPATAVDFTDNLPAGLVVAETPNAVNNCTGGTLTATAGSGTITYTGGTIAALSTCAISVDVVAAETGDYDNVSGDLTSSFGNSGPASDTLNVSGAPMFTKAFNPEEVAPGGISTLTFTIDNSANTAAATDLEFTDVFPDGLEFADPANLVNDCGGMVELEEDDGDDGNGEEDTAVILTGGTVAAGATCTISVDVMATGAGTLMNDAGVLSSSLGQSMAGTATATLGAGTVLDIPTASGKALILFAGLLGLLALVAFRRMR